MPIKRNLNPLIERYGSEKRWVNWKLQERKGKTTKVPYSPVTGSLASSTDEATWAAYDDAKSHSDNVGIVFTPSQMLLGIDIDHCLKDNEIVHEKKEEIEALLAAADSYTEISPSGEGLHIFLELSDPLKLRGNKKSPFELYTSGRYFTVTEQPFKISCSVRRVSSKECEALLDIIGYPWKESSDDFRVSKENVEKSREIVSSRPEISGNELSDQSILEKMFVSKNGVKIKALYEGNISEYDNDPSKADMALCSHFAFWTNKNAAQIESLWLSSPIGSRKKTTERADYRTRTINAAIAACKEGYKPHEMPRAIAAAVNDENEIDLLFIPSKDGKTFILNTENICRVLRKHPAFANRLRYDAFKNNLEISVERGNTAVWRSIETNDVISTQTAISILFPCFLKVGKDMVFDAMIKVAKECEMDSAIDFIKGIHYDGKPRLDVWLSRVFGAPEDSYHAAVGSNWLKGLVKRIIQPGCKFDYVLVLEGEQGSKKSTSLAILGGDWHVETAMSTESKDFFMQFAGKAIVEFSEGETLSRTEVKRMKAIITMQKDKYRPPYERVSQDFPRRCVFAMTTNQSDYLKDETGNRRWLPVKVLKDEADIEWLEENREQLYAEAYHRIVELKEKIYEFPKEETKIQQELRRIHDPNADMIVDWYFKKLVQDERNRGVTIHQVFRDVLHSGFSSKPLDRVSEMNIADVFRSVLSLTKKQAMQDGVRTTRWYPSTLMSLINDDGTEKTTADEILDRWPDKV